MAKKQSQAIFYELLRSYASLAKTLNLSKTVRELGSTRQTVRRHIALLEAKKGEKLFALEDRQYRLTQAGEESLQEAETLLTRMDAWLSNQSDHIGGLTHLAFDPERNGSDFYYYLQQHPFGRLWQDSSEFLQFGFQSWVKSKGQIESPEFNKIRPYLIIFRQVEDNWICAEVGEKSSFSTWHGWSKQRSSVGRAIKDLPGGERIARLLTQPFRDVQTHGGTRLDHVFMYRKTEDQQEAIPTSFQRLLMGCWFPDGSFALASLVDRTHNIVIEGLDAELARSMPEKYVMDVDVTKLSSVK